MALSSVVLFFEMNNSFTNKTRHVLSIPLIWAKKGQIYQKCYFVLIVGLLICTLISENQGLEKSILNLRKIQVLQTFSPWKKAEFICTINLGVEPLKIKVWSTQKAESQYFYGLVDQIYTIADENFNTKMFWPHCVRDDDKL